MKFLITKGKAIIKDNDLRCAISRFDDSYDICNKLIARKNEQGQICGNFRCERCHQEVELKMD